MQTNNQGTRITSAIMLSDTRKFKISTYKYNGKIITTASCCTLDGYFETFTIYKDFMTTLRETTHKRITKQMVDAQHTDCLKWFDIFKGHAEHFYKEKEQLAA